MQSSGSVGKIRFRTTLGVLLIALCAVPLIASFLGFLARYSAWIYLNHVCLVQSRSLPGSAAFSSPFAFESTNDEKACNRYLQSYFFSLGRAGPDQVRAAQANQKQADDLVGAKGFARCMEQLRNTACFIETWMNMPLVAEAYERCAVSQCRRHATDARATNTSQQEELFFLLADQTESLAKLFVRHGKVEIADRAYQDAIVSALQAISEDSASTMRIERYYLAYADFLLSQEREDEALAILSKMDMIAR